MQIIAKHICFFPPPTVAWAANAFQTFVHLYFHGSCTCIERHACQHTQAHGHEAERPQSCSLKWADGWLTGWEDWTLEFFFLPAIFLMGAFQPSGLKGKCKLRDKLPCVMMRHESKGRTNGTDYMCARCAKKRSIALLWIQCIRSWDQSSAVMAVTWWPSGSVSSCSSYPNCPASPAA